MNIEEQENLNGLFARVETLERQNAELLERLTTLEAKVRPGMAPIP